MAVIDTHIDTQQHERRASARRRLLKNVQLLELDKKSSSVRQATLRNLSRSGAMLSGLDPAHGRLPGQFYLVAPGQLRMIRCKMMWKTYDELGIRFLTNPGALVEDFAPGDDAHTKADERVDAQPKTDERVDAQPKADERDDAQPKPDEREDAQPKPDERDDGCRRGRAGQSLRKYFTLLLV